MVSKFSGYRFPQCGSSREGDMKVMLKLGGKLEFVTKTIQILREVQTKKKGSGGCYLSRRQNLCPPPLPAPTASARADEARVTDFFGLHKSTGHQRINFTFFTVLPRTTLVCVMRARIVGGVAHRKYAGVREGAEGRA